MALRRLLRANGWAGSSRLTGRVRQLRANTSLARTTVVRAVADVRGREPRPTAMGTRGPSASARILAAARAPTDASACAPEEAEATSW
jgi:hypothetical protein